MTEGRRPQSGDVTYHPPWEGMSVLSALPTKLTSGSFFDNENLIR